MERIVGVPARPQMAVRRPKRLLALRSDQRLVELLRAGEDTAFEVLYERHVAGVLSFCRHMLGSQEEAEDAVQQAFVSAHHDMLQGSREIAFKPWLYTIARNGCLSMLRARREYYSAQPELSTVGLHEAVERRSDLRELVADLQRLPEPQRAALVLTELRDLSYAEVAEVLGQEPAAVKGIVFRARSAMVERRDARRADCFEIRKELATATGGAFRRRRLRYHLETCPGCVAYMQEFRRQRKLLGIALPVVPTLGLQQSVMASVGIGTGSAGVAGALVGGGAATAGAPLFGGTLAKVAVLGALAAGGATVATEAVRDGGGRDGAPATPAEVRQGSGQSTVPASARAGGGRDGEAPGRAGRGGSEAGRAPGGAPASVGVPSDGGSGAVPGATGGGQGGVQPDEVVGGVKRGVEELPRRVAPTPSLPDLPSVQSPSVPDVGGGGLELPDLPSVEPPSVPEVGGGGLELPDLPSVEPPSVPELP